MLDTSDSTTTAILKISVNMLSQTEKAFIFFVAVGALSVLTILYKMSRFSYVYPRSGSLKKYNKNGGAWALVTGSSDDIGASEYLDSRSTVPFFRYLMSSLLFRYVCMSGVGDSC
jgi:hypothetical protein